MSALVRAGATGVDFSFAKPPARRLVELGYSFVVGYLSVPPASPSKNITRTDCETYLAAGLKVLLVWEMTATRASLGASVGRFDGAAAANLADVRGCPHDVPILAADDTDVNAHNIADHVAYMEAFAEACDYPIGIYGDIDILTHCKGLWRIGWVPNAWAWSGTSRAIVEAKARAVGAHVLQRKGFWIDNLWAVDPNEAIADFAAWGAPQPQPPPEADDMGTVFFQVEGMPGQYMWTPGTAPIPFTNPTDRDVLLRGLHISPDDGGTISQEMFQRLAPVDVAAFSADTFARQGVSDVQDSVQALKGRLREAGE